MTASTHPRTRLFSAAIAMVASTALLGALLVSPSARAETTTSSDGDYVVTRLDDTINVAYDAARYASMTTLRVTGTLQVAIVDRNLAAPLGSLQPLSSEETEYAYAVVRDDGVTIPITADLPEGLTNGAEFTGDVVVPDAVLASAKVPRVAKGSRVSGTSAAGTAIAEATVQSDVALPLASAQIASAVASPSGSATTRAHRAYVAVVSPVGAANPMTLAAATATVTSAGTYWTQQTNGRISSFTVAQALSYSSSGSCSMSAQARWNEAAKRFSFSSGTVNHLVVLLPSSCMTNYQLGLGTVGLGLHQVGGNLAAVEAINDGTRLVPTLAHEFGHNVGLLHAGSWSCTASCDWTEYSDPYSVMGFAYVDNNRAFDPPALDAGSLDSLGAATAGQGVISSLTPGASATETITLMPITSATGARYIKAIEPGTGNAYFVEYRAGTGQDAKAAYNYWDTFVPGVRISTLTEDRATYSYTFGASRVLASGGSFVSDNGRMRIALSGTPSAASGAQITVSFAQSGTLGTPTAAGAAGRRATIRGIAGPFKVWRDSRLGATLKVEGVTWLPADTATRYQWYRNGKAIAGATKATYTTVNADAKKTISVVIIGVRSGTTDYRSPMYPMVIVTAAKLGKTSKPTITGTAKVGKKLKVKRGKWTSGVKFSYQWYANGKAIAGATKSTYKLTKANKGKRITVKVTGKKIGYYTVTKASKKTAKVAKK